MALVRSISITRIKMNKLTPAHPAMTDASPMARNSRLRGPSDDAQRDAFLAELKRQVSAGEYKPDPREVARTLVHILVPPD